MQDDWSPIACPCGCGAMIRTLADAERIREELLEGVVRDRFRLGSSVDDLELPQREQAFQTLDTLLSGGKNVC